MDKTMGQLFGTDGIRGIANKGLDALLAFRVGQAAAIVLSKNKGASAEKLLFTIGKDTRISSDMLEAALIAGLCSAGASVMPLGVLPTPAVAFITVSTGADAGIVISASHNPYEHNGIKIFNSKGFKLSDELESEIEEYVLSGEPLPEKSHGDIGRVLPENEKWVDAYIEHIIGCAECEIKGIKVVIDCANGAAYTTAERIFSQFELEYEIIKDHPNGVNINDKCGSTHTDALSAMVVSGGYDLGIAFDGDADRCLIVDELGNLVDGDKMMGVCARHMMKAGTLKGNAIVSTVMSNIGFHRFGQKNDLRILSAAVGDKNVLEMMISGGYNLGGEQSGHLIFLDESTTGDGQLAAVKFLSALIASGKRASELASEIPQFPQVLINVPVGGGNKVKNVIMDSDELKNAIENAEKDLKGEGRILVRPSGTEALIRVTVEAFDMKVAKDTAEMLASLLKVCINHVNC
jgi:phosphoglucosamine mutase